MSENSKIINKIKDSRNTVRRIWRMIVMKKVVSLLLAGIMAAGAFVQGSSIELSADSPIKEPYVAYLQGGLTYEHALIAIKKCVQSINDLRR